MSSKFNMSHVRSAALNPYSRNPETLKTEKSPCTLHRIASPFAGTAPRNATPPPSPVSQQMTELIRTVAVACLVLGAHRILEAAACQGEAAEASFHLAVAPSSSCAGEVPHPWAGEDPCRAAEVLQEAHRRAPEEAASLAWAGPGHTWAEEDPSLHGQGAHHQGEAQNQGEGELSLRRVGGRRQGVGEVPQLEGTKLELRQLVRMEVWAA